MNFVIWNVLFILCKTKNNKFDIFVTYQMSYGTLQHIPTRTAQYSYEIQKY